MKILSLVNKLNKNFSSCLFRPALQSWNYSSLYGSQLNINDVKPFFKDQEDSEFTKLEIYKNESYTMYLMRWGAGYTYPEHYHENQRCLLKVIEGELEETRFSNEETTKYNLSNGGVAYIDDTLGSHSVFNTTNNYTYSLHMYYEYNYKLAKLDN